MQPLAALVAVQALAVLTFNRRAPFLGEADDLAFVRAVGHMQGAGAVAGFTDAAFGVIAWVFAENLGVLGVAEQGLLGVVAVAAAFFADVPGVGHGVGVGQRGAHRQQAQQQRRHGDRAEPADRKGVDFYHA